MTSSNTPLDLDGNTSNQPTARRLRRNWFTVLAAFTIMALLITGFELARTTSIAQAQTRYSQAASTAHNNKAKAQEASDAAAQAITDAQSILSTSAGHTLDETARDTLSSSLDTATNLQQRILLDIETAREALRAAAPAGATFSSDLEPALDNITQLRFAHTSHLIAATKELTTATEAVTAAVAAWQAEQDRIAAEAAEAAAAAAAASRSAGITRTGDGSFYLYVSGSAGAGGQGAIDACTGAINITGWYGVATIAEHWGCGGSNFPRGAGAIIHLSGIMEGTYRTEGIVTTLDVSVNDVSDVPGGYDLLFQTCLNNNSHTMAFVGLTRIG